MDTPRTRYAKSGDLSIAYQVIGDGPIDLVHIPGIVSHVDLAWEHPGYARFMQRLSSFARVMVFDKRGMGASDPVSEPPAIEERIDDARAVMDAAGSERAVIFGCSEGTCLASFFAATYPDRVSALVLYGSLARFMPDPPDYPWGFEPEMIESMMAAIPEVWGEGGLSLTLIAPSKLGNEKEMEWWGRFERASVSPGMQVKIATANAMLDIRDILPLVRTPTLLIHRKADTLPIEGARYMAERIPDARLIELEGEDHWPWIDNPDEVCDLVEEFVTGVKPTHESDRVLATVMFTDIVGSTERAAEVGDNAWRRLLDGHEEITRRELKRYMGHEVKQTGDGFLATFDGPARAVRCATAIAAGVRTLGLEVRAGLHTGECELRNGDVGGIAVHIGSRVAGLADASEVIVSSTVRDLTVGSDIEFEDRGTHELKGVPGEWRLFAARA